MNIIRTAEDLARALSQPPDTELKTLLQAHAARLAAYDDYDLSELAMFAVLQPTDDLDTINAEIGWSLLDDGTFAKPVELIARHSGWYEVTFILSDDGFGLLAYAPITEGTNRDLIAACETALTEQQGQQQS